MSEGVAELVHHWRPARSGVRKITVSLPAALIDDTLEISGKGLTETLRDALTAYNRDWARRQLLSRAGTMTVGATWQELAGKDDEA